MTPNRPVALGIVCILLVVGAACLLTLGGKEPGADGSSTAGPGSPSTQPRERPAPETVALEEAPVVRIPGSNESTTSGSLVAQVVQLDARDSRIAVAGVPVLIAQARGRTTGEFREVGTTDPNGESIVGGLMAGSWRVRTRETEPRPVEVLPDQATRVELVMPRALPVGGVVVDGSGRVVAGAEVWLSEPSTTLRGQAVATTDEAGRFSLACAGQFRCLSARAVGFAPSKPIPIVEREGERIELRLVLEIPGGEVRGRVTDDAGKPVSGARISIGEPAMGGGQFLRLIAAAPEDPSSASLMQLLAAPPLVLASDDAGEFMTASAPRGAAVPVHADAPGFGVASRSITVPSGEPITIVLQAAVTVRGTVTSADGAPLPGIAVQAGRFRRGDPGWERKSVFTDREGSYEVRGLTGGDLPLEVDDGAWGKASATLSAAPGATVVWSPALTPGLVLSLRVVDDTGEPRAGWSVSAWGPQEEGRHSRTGRTDPGGRVRFIHCKDASYNFTVGDPAAFVQMPVMFEQGYRPGSEHTLVLAERTRPSAYVHANLVDPDGNPATATVTVFYKYGSKGRSVVGDSRMGPLLPGSYRLRLHHESYAPIHTDEFELVAGQTLSLGALRFQPFASLEIDLVDAHGRPLDAAKAQVRACNRFDQYEAEPLGGRLSIARLPPGDYFLTGIYPGCSVSVQRVDALAGGRGVAVVRLEPGAPRLFRIEGGYAPELLWRNDRGELLFRERLQRDMHSSGPTELQRAFPPGNYSVTAKRRPWDTSVVKVDFRTTEDGEAAPAVVIALGGS